MRGRPALGDAEGLDRSPVLGTTLSVSPVAFCVHSASDDRADCTTVPRVRRGGLPNSQGALRLIRSGWLQAFTRDAISLDNFAGVERAFFGYASEPALTRQIVAAGADKVRGLGLVEVTTWEDLVVSGHLIIDEVTRAIDECDVACFDATSLNRNVLFEIGYAIGAGKRLWLLFDESDDRAKNAWNRVRTLTTLGYSAYQGSDDIRAKYLRDMPHVGGGSVLERHIRPALRPGKSASVFYLASPHRDDVSREVSRRVANEAIGSGPILEADPQEGAAYSLEWFAQRIYWSGATLVHLVAERRVGSDVHNARGALVAGLAHGLGKPVLLLHEESERTPIDYRDLAYPYVSPAGCVAAVDAWLNTIHEGSRETTLTSRLQRLEFSTELRSLSFGEHVAENEREDLLDYFVETSAQVRIESGTSLIVVGRKGAGKTASFYFAADRLKGDSRNLVAVVKPPAYEFRELIDYISTLEARSARNFLVDAIWQFVIVTELAVAALQELQDHVGPLPDSAEHHLMRLADDDALGLRLDMTQRVDLVLKRFVRSSDGADVETSEQQRIVESVLGGSVRELRNVLGDILGTKRRAFVLLDNLDKAWDSASDLHSVARLLLGLLSAARRTDQLLRRHSSRDLAIDCTIAVFLRTDVFEAVAEAAAEPDKLVVQPLRWDQPDALLRVVEERFRASTGVEQASELWEKYFPRDFDGVPVQQYLGVRLLPRPRDIIYYCGAAVDSAINAGHERVQEEDLLAADVAYSEYALDVLIVEGRAVLPHIEDLIFGFSGVDAILSASELALTVTGTIGDSQPSDEVIELLLGLSFAGIEIADGEFSYADSRRMARRDAVLASRLGRPPRYEIHPAFRPFLQIADR